MSDWKPSPEYLQSREIDAKIQVLVFRDKVTPEWPCGIDYDTGELRASQSNPAKHPRLYNERHPAVVDGNGAWPVPEYSTDIAEALRAAEELPGSFALVRLEDAYEAAFYDFDSKRLFQPIAHDTAAGALARATVSAAFHYQELAKASV